MNKFFNITSSGDTATILLYGIIGDAYSDVTSANIVREIKEAEAAYGKIEVRINSIGGEVYAGIAIYNALKNSKADIRIYVDGIAASMASVIALCGKPAYMSRYALLMFHCVSGGGCGTVRELKKVCEEMESLEGTLIDMYSKKTGKTPEEIKTLYFDGADHYLTAKEALELGFIDGIYDADPMPENSNPEQVYAIVNKRLDRPINNKSMNILERFRTRRLFTNAKDEDDVIAIVEKMETDLGKATDLENKVTALEAELKVFRDKAKADEEAAQKAILDAAVADGRITNLQREIYAAILKKDRVNGEAILNSLPVKKRVMNYVGTQDEAAPGAWVKRMEEINNKKGN